MLIVAIEWDSAPTTSCAWTCAERGSRAQLREQQNFGACSTTWDVLLPHRHAQGIVHVGRACAACSATNRMKSKAALPVVLPKQQGPRRVQGRMIMERGEVSVSGQMARRWHGDRHLHQQPRAVRLRQFCGGRGIYRDVTQRRNLERTAAPGHHRHADGHSQPPRVSGMRRVGLCPFTQPTASPDLADAGPGTTSRPSTTVLATWPRCR